MSYLDIDNLYKNQDILLFKECYVLEKIHGTSAHINLFREKIMYFGPSRSESQPEFTYKVNFFSGGEKYDNFIKLFDVKFIEQVFSTLNIDKMTIYGEAYGGKQQGMSATYGKELKFVVFDVKIGDCWLSVPQAEEMAKQFGLEFVWWNKVSTELFILDNVRDSDSEQALRNGMGEGHKREGIVIRPIIELKKNNGERIIAKHKRVDFQETKTPREVSPEKLKVLEDANAIAEEWVTPMRLIHVLDKIENPTIEKMGIIMKAMIEDVEREGKGELIESKEARRAIGKKTATLFKEYLNRSIK